MTFAEFDKFQEELFNEVRHMKLTKGKEYANSETDRFANFNRLSQNLGIPNFQVGWVYAAKHMDSIVQAMRTQTFTGRVEPLRGRFVDFITYLTLIAGMIEETEKPKEKNQNACGCGFCEKCQTVVDINF